MTPIRILFVNHNCYLDDSNGAAVASRNQMEALARHGFEVEALTGSVLELGDEANVGVWLARQGLDAPLLGGTWTADAGGVRADVPPHYRLTVNGVAITIHAGPSTHRHWPDATEHADFVQLFEAIAARSRPDIVVGYGGGAMIAEVFARVRTRGGAVVFALHNFAYHDRSAFAHVDRVFVPSRFSADSYRRTLGLECTILPNLVNFDRVLCDRPSPGYVTFVNPSVEKGVFVFARIADELGKQRPDIPFLLVEGRGTEATVAACGLDLRRHGTVHFLNHPADPRRFWRETRICLMPSLWLESQGLVAIEAMINGIPVIASNRGALPGTLGGAGVVLPLPERLTSATRSLPTPEEVSPWVEAICRLWDDALWAAELGRKAQAEAERWAPAAVEPQHAAFFASLAADG